MKKGISPLLASVLLIAVTVSIATLVMGWMSTVARSTQSSVSNKTAQATECSSAIVIIDDVYVNAGSPGRATAIVRNAGQVNGMAISSAQLYNRTGSNFTAMETASGPLTGFDMGEIQTLRFNSTYISACPTDFSAVIVTTNCGGVSATFDSTPKCS